VFFTVSDSRFISYAKKSARRAALGDKHKANFDEGVPQPPQQFNLILAPMAPGGLKPPHPVASLALVLPVRRS